MLMTVEDIAKAILHTADTREAMFNEEAYRCETQSWQRRWLENHNEMEIHYGLVANPYDFYYWSIEEAAEHSLRYLRMDKRLARLIDLALHGWWNDTIDWAEEVLNKNNGEIVVYEETRNKTKTLQEIGRGLRNTDNEK